MRTKILAIDDDENFLGFLKQNLEDIGYNIMTVSNSNTAIDALSENSFDCVLLDVRIPGVNGIELLKISLQKCATTPVIMVSGQSSIKIAVEAIKLGAFDFIEKPIDIPKLHITIKNAIDRKSLSKEKENLFSELQENYRLVGKSEAIKKIIFHIKMVADTSAKVLIQGETGTGKEPVAWAIHHNSSRSANPYLKVNCAAIPNDLLESELFGYKKGAFTGADRDKQGKFIAADGGTLCLDEIGDMNLSLQAKILRILEEDEVDVLGENSPRKIDVRIIAATNQDLDKKIEEGSFRKDLYFRLNVANIFIPPLRERVEDILPLAYHFLKKHNETFNKQVLSISTNAEQVLLEYNYPGNVRELRNIIEKCVLYSKSNILELIDIQNALNLKDSINDNCNSKLIDKSFKSAKSEFEKKYIIAQLEEHDWNISKTAETMEVDRSNLFRKIQILGIKEKMKIKN